MTLLGPIAVVLGAQIPLPGMDMKALFALHQGADPGSVPTLGLTTVGLGPIVAAAILVELVAWLVSGWNALRHAGHDGRRRLGRVAVALGLLLAFFQAYGLAKFLDAVGGGGPSVYNQPGLQAVTILVCTWVAATSCYLWLAQLITARGLANGFVVLLVSFACYDGVGELRSQLVHVAQSYPDHNALAAGAMHWNLLIAGVALVIAATAIVLWPRKTAVDDLPEPASGVGAITAAAQALGAPAGLILGVFGLSYAGELASPLTQLDSEAFSAVWLVVALVAAAAFAVGFYWPGRVGAAWRRAGLARDAPKLGPIIVTSVAFVLALHLVQQALLWTIEAAVDVVMVALATALAFDVVREWRARGKCSTLVAVWPEQRPYLVSAACRALAAEGIEAHARSFSQRRVLQGLGPFVPIEIMVPQARAAEACAILEPLLTLGDERASPAASDEVADRPSAAHPLAWRRLAVLGAVSLLCVVGAVTSHRALTSLAERPTDVSPVELEFIAVDDESNPLQGLASGDESRLPAGVSLEVENAPIGPGRTNPVYYATTRTKTEQPPAEFVTWLDAIPRPAGTRFLLARTYELDLASEAYLPSGWRSYLLTGAPVLNQDHVSQARARPGSGNMMGGWTVDVQFDEQGAELFQQYTREHVKRRFAIVVDGIVSSVPVIMEEIEGGSARISMGAGSLEQQRDDAQRLAAGLEAAATTRSRR